MAKLMYTYCKCLRRGDCFVPGTRGHLSLVTANKTYFIRRCHNCKNK